MNDDDFWGNTNPTDVFIDTMNSKEIMSRSHITELYTHKHKEIFTTELLKKVSNVPRVSDEVQKCQLDSSNKSKNLNMLSKTSNVKHTNDINLSS